MASRKQKQAPKWEIGETVRAKMTFIHEMGYQSYGYRRATIVAFPDDWRNDAGARITVRDTKGEVQEVHFGSIYADWGYEVSH